MSVPLVVIGQPVAINVPPVEVAPTEVTVPPASGEEIVISAPSLVAVHERVIPVHGMRLSTRALFAT